MEKFSLLLHTPQQWYLFLCQKAEFEKLIKLCINRTIKFCAAIFIFANCWIEKKFWFLETSKDVELILFENKWKKIARFALNLEFQKDLQHLVSLKFSLVIPTAVHHRWLGHATSLFGVYVERTSFPKPWQEKFFDLSPWLVQGISGFHHGSTGKFWIFDQTAAVNSCTQKKQIEKTQWENYCCFVCWLLSHLLSRILIFLMILQPLELSKSSSHLLGATILYHTSISRRTMRVGLFRLVLFVFF